MKGVRSLMAYGETVGEVADEAGEIVQQRRLASIVHRTDSLQELLADFLRGRMHTLKKKKKLLSIERNGLRPFFARAERRMSVPFSLALTMSIGPM